jgi:hypothetical protein
MGIANINVVLLVATHGHVPSCTYKSKINPPGERASQAGGIADLEIDLNCK